MVKAEDKQQKSIVLLVEDDPAVRRSLQLVLQGSGFLVRSHATGAALLADPNVGTAQAMVADYRLPDSDGVRLLQDMQKAGFRGQAILVTGFGSPELEMSARAAGYARVLEKPLADRVLRETMAGLFS
ncbi:MAG: response regulator [Sphingomonas sp.]|nr:response regulator [Sphingomonas sp.]